MHNGDRKKGADPRTIAHLLMEKRTRKKARQYYGMGERNVSLNVLTYQEFVQQYSTLMNENAGLNLIDRYLTVVRHLSPRQVADFIKRIPAEVRKELTRYEELYLVVDTLKKSGISLKFTKPENLICGLTDEQYTQALRKDGRIPLQKSGKQQEQPKEALQPPQHPMDTAKETVTETGTEEPSKSKEEDSFGTENFFFAPQTETVVEQAPHPVKATEPAATATKNSLNQRKISKKPKTVAQLKEKLRILKKQQKQDKKRRTEENKRERKLLWSSIFVTLVAKKYH